MERQLKQNGVELIPGNKVEEIIQFEQDVLHTAE